MRRRLHQYSVIVTFTVADLVFRPGGRGLLSKARKIRGTSIWGWQSHQLRDFGENLKIQSPERQFATFWVTNNREFKIRHVAVPVPVVDKQRSHFAMFGLRHEEVESLRCISSPSPSIFLKHFFMTRSEHRKVMTGYHVHDGDGDGDMTNLKLPNKTFLRIFVGCRTLKILSKNQTWQNKATHKAWGKRLMGKTNYNPWNLHVSHSVKSAHKVV